MLSTLLGIEWLPVSMVGCDDCDLAGISFISAHPEIRMSVPNEDIPGCRSFRTAMMHKGVVAQPKPERLPDVVRNSRSSRVEGKPKVNCRTTYEGNAIRASQRGYGRQWQSRTTRDTTVPRVPRPFISIAALFHGCWHPRNRHERLRYLIEQLARILFFAQ